MRLESDLPQENIDLLWTLSEKLKIPLWKNFLSLPASKQKYSPAAIDFQKEFKFIYLYSEKHNKAEVFIGESSDIPQVLSLVSFLFDDYSCYLCPERLIIERLSKLEGSNSIDDENEVTYQLHDILERAIEVNASDVHIESLSDQKRIRIRVDGLLQILKIDKVVEESLFVKIKLTAGMDIAIKRAPQDGHFHYLSSKGKRFDLRVSTIPGVHGEQLVMRLLGASAISYSLEGLGCSEEQLKIFRSVLLTKIGMVLITGPTGSGKTTLLYAMLKEILSDTLNIVTIEDPVEYQIDQITQVEVNDRAGISFSSALRSFLRQDPDVILVGEIRDQETAVIAARAAQTGHLVFSTLHSGNVFETITRLRSLGVEGDDLASSLKMVVSQRLVRKFCHCKGQDENCHDCNGSGNQGRIPVQEVLVISPEIKNLISDNASEATILAKARQAGFISLKEEASKLFETGSISKESLNQIG